MAVIFKVDLVQGSFVYLYIKSFKNMEVLFFSLCNMNVFSVRIFLYLEKCYECVLIC